MGHNKIKKRQSHLSFTDDSYIDEQIHHFVNEFASDSSSILCHTSGSTGIPKDILLQKSAMLYSAKNTVNYFGLNQHSLGLLCLPAKYIAGRMMLVRAFVSNMKLHSVQPSLNPLKKIQHTSIHFAAFTPAQVSEILADEETFPIFSSIKHVIIGGAAIDADLEKKLLSFPNAIYATYGMTETVSHIALRKVGEDSYEKLSAETILGVDTESCLWIEDKNLTQERLQTNDVVQLLDENYFTWLGRRDFVINSGGVKLYPEQIEAKIKANPDWITQTFFISKIDDVRFGERPLLVLEKNESIPDLNSLRGVLNKTEMPKEMLVVPQFVYTESGKLNRAETLKLLNL